MDSQKGRFGLYESEISQLQEIFADFPEIEEVWIFGSRSMGNYQFNSDFDLAIKGKAVNQSLINAVKEKLEDDFFPLRFDLVDYQTLNNLDLLTHIREEGRLLFRKNLDSVQD